MTQFTALKIAFVFSQTIQFQFPSIKIHHHHHHFILHKQLSQLLIPLNLISYIRS
jgi:tagatose-1,6-bisphosphate aldolase non-catalytic subunit AgaZ/GatZ